MSKIDKHKEEIEYQMFLDACDYCSSNAVHEITQNIMSFLNGQKVERSKQDHPDIITLCKKGNKETAVGIEVFCVDQNSGNKKGKFVSKSKESEHLINNVYEKGHEELLEDENVSDENCEQLLLKSAELASDKLNSSADTLIAAFEQHFNKHADNTKEYLQEIRKYAAGKEAALAFLINIESCFHDITAFKDNHFITYSSKLAPFLSEIISIIEKHPNKKDIDYMVFYLTAHNSKESRVVAIRAGQIRKNLEKQGETIYKNLISSPVKLQIDPNGVKHTENAEFSLNYKIEVDQRQIDAIEEKARHFKKLNIPFVMFR